MTDSETIQVFNAAKHRAVDLGFTLQHFDNLFLLAKAGCTFKTESVQKLSGFLEGYAHARYHENQQ